MGTLTIERYGIEACIRPGKDKFATSLSGRVIYTDTIDQAVSEAKRMIEEQHQQQQHANDQDGTA